MSQEAEQTPAVKYQNPIVLGITLLFAGVSVALIQYKIPTIMTAIMGLFSMDAATASWLMSIFTLASIFVAIPAGNMAQRFGAKRVMFAALLLAVVGSLIGMFANMTPVLIISRAIEGAALTIVTTCGPIIVQRSVAADKVGTTMGIFGIWGCIGSTIAALVTPTIFGNLGFQGLWGIFAAIAVIAAVVLMVVVRETPAPVPTADELEVQPASAEPPRYREIFTRDVLLFFIGFAMFNICLLAILSFVPTILQMQGYDQTLSGFISTAPMLMSILSSPLFGIVADKIGRFKPLLVLAMAVMGPCTFIMYTNTGPLLWVAVVIMGLIGMGGVGLFLSGYTKILARPELASIAMGVMICVQGIGQFLGTFLVQALLGPDLLNWFFAGAVIMVLGLAGAGALALIKKMP